LEGRRWGARGGGRRYHFVFPEIQAREGLLIVAECSFLVIYY
jgi:hypothetical protein